jgi:hypothetical protein
MDRERIALYAGTVAAYADMYVTQPILPLLSAEFGVGAARAGLTVSAVVLAIAAASAFYGPLADALGRRRVMAGPPGPSPSRRSRAPSPPRSARSWRSAPSRARSCRA